MHVENPTDVADPGPRTRRVRFEFPAEFDPVWTPRLPEFSAAANSVSLMMPHIEPLVVRSVRAVHGRLEPDLATIAARFEAQESQHQSQHRRFNERLTESVPSLTRVESWFAKAVGALSRRWSEEFAVAFAAGFETIAFSIARWTSERSGDLFRGADPLIATLYMWHLAEEVEHKSVAFDVYRAIDGSRIRYLAATLMALVLLGFFTVIGTVASLLDQRRLLNPVTWWRLTCWSVGLAFEVLPNVFAASVPSHHPSAMADPIVLSTWLDQFDEETQSIPLWWTGESAAS